VAEPSKLRDVGGIHVGHHPNSNPTLIPILLLS